MRFGQQLRASLYPEWRFYYVDYDGLKDKLKMRPGLSSYREGDESTFVQLLEHELEKVYDFQKLKFHEITRRVEYAESRTKALETLLLPPTTPSSPARSAAEDATGSPDPVSDSDESAVSSSGEPEDDSPESKADLARRQQERESEELETEVHSITTEINELQRFTRLNYSAFLKIIKKHDKYTNYSLRPVFMVRLNARPFYKENFDALVLRLSRLYDRIRNIRAGPEAAAEKARNASAVTAGGAQDFVRRTTKYWVHPDNVFELKMYILRYLPVLVFRSTPSDNSRGATDADGADDSIADDVDASITSIYFDNDQLDLYLGRLEKSENAEAIRMRWYGPVTNTEIFVERKTHREDWTGEASVKQRFPLKEKNVNAYIRGDFTLDKAISKMRASGLKSESEINALQSLSREIYASIRDKRLKPVMRTFYHRTAFQLPGDARVRISLDTELSMVREDDFDGKERAGLNWRRRDVRTDYPFSHLDDSEICRFPYAVLEVKLQTAAGGDPPAWVKALIDSHLVEEVPKFSKFIHGCSSLLESHVPLLPFWLPQMDKDIRKSNSVNSKDSLIPREGPFAPISRAASRPVSRPASQHALNAPVPLSKNASDDQIEVVVHAPGRQDHPTTPRRSYRAAPVTSPSSLPIQGSSRDVQSSSRGGPSDETAPLLGSRSTSRPSSIRSSRSSRSGHTWGSAVLQRLFKRRSDGSPAKGKKRVAVPVRVEPKVFFANERTFLSWLHFAVVLGGLALGLMNFGDRSGMLAGALFTLVAGGIMLYALYTYRWRAERIRQRLPGPYDDQQGPVVLVVAIFAAVGVNFWLKFSDI